MLVPEPQGRGATPFVWQVGALCRAAAGLLDARFNPVAVCGEVSSFSRAASGHCYFSVKDDDGQLRCAMFRRSASLLDFAPGNGDRVELRGRLSVYEARGDLQLVVESMQRAGAGVWFERFVLLKNRLEAEGLFAAARKRALPRMPRSIGVVTSLGAAALHDVLTALRRRVPHLPVVVAPARVQGEGAAAELCDALSNLYRMNEAGRAPGLDSALDRAASQPARPGIDLILLVRGGGSIEDLWAFNDERLARAIVGGTVPVIVGVGHETDFTIADFCADLRAPTPTAAAELAAEPRAQSIAALDERARRLRLVLRRRLDAQAQRLDRAAAQLARPSAIAHLQQLTLARQRQRLQAVGGAQAARQRSQWQSWQRRLQTGATSGLERQRRQLQLAQQRLGRAFDVARQRARQRLGHAEQGLSLLDPSLVLRRGYAWLADADSGRAIAGVSGLRVGMTVQARLADGSAELTVQSTTQGG